MVWLDPHGHEAAGSIQSMKNPNDLIGSRIRDHPGFLCSVSTLIPIFGQLLEIWRYFKETNKNKTLSANHKHQARIKTEQTRIILGKVKGKMASPQSCSRFWHAVTQHINILHSCKHPWLPPHAILPDCHVFKFTFYFRTAPNYRSIITHT